MLGFGVNNHLLKEGGGSGELVQRNTKNNQDTVHLEW